MRMTGIVGLLILYGILIIVLPAAVLEGVILLLKKRK